MRPEPNPTFVAVLARALKARAGQIGYGAADTEAAVSQVLKLCTIRDDHGGISRAIRIKSSVLVFSLFGLKGRIRLETPAARPCDTVGPFVDDRRVLGVLVGRVTLLDDQQKHEITAHFSTDPLPGWHAPVAGGTMRWTSGRAELPFLPVSDGRVRMLAVELVSFGPYFEAYRLGDVAESRPIETA